MVERRTLGDDTAAKVAAFPKHLERPIEDGDFERREMENGTRS